MIVQGAGQGFLKVPVPAAGDALNACVDGFVVECGTEAVFGRFRLGPEVYFDVEHHPLQDVLFVGKHPNGTGHLQAFEKDAAGGDRQGHDGSGARAGPVPAIPGP